MNMIMDTCSIVLLAKATVLETLTSLNNIIITEDVFNEAEKGKEKMLPDALLVGRLASDKKISIIKSDVKLKSKLMADFNMGGGEASTIAAVIKEKNRIVATDNLQGRKAALVNNHHFFILLKFFSSN
ncbi:hypothetical protein HYS31_04465 [Candidatus Woesearchaeota archaeon]|nr:hypothetical protein [Candidatus Woesearchaeota archaeon]